MSVEAWLSRGPALDALPPGEEPATGITIGPADAEPIGVHLSKAAADQIDRAVERAARRDPAHNVSGLLVGYALQGRTRPFVVIAGALTGGDAETPETAFTPAVWEGLAARWQSEYPGTLIVGRFHSRPGERSALTSYDAVLHQRFFAHSWQLSFIVDPLAKSAAFYRSEGERISRVAGFMVFDMRALQHATSEPDVAALRQPDAAVDLAAATRDAPVAARKRANWRTWLVLAVLLAMVWLALPGLPGSIPSLLAHLHDRSAQLDRLEQDLGQLKSEQDRLAASGAPAASGGPAPSAGAPAASPPVGAAGVGGTAGAPAPTRATGTASAGRVSPTTQTPPGRAPSGSGYVIQPGDTLWKISAATLGDPKAYGQLAKANGIQDPDLIYPGKALNVPADADKTAAAVNSHP